MQHLNLVFPQWQGNTEQSPLYGALEFMGLYLCGLPIRLAEVAESCCLSEEADIIARGEIVRQLKSCFALLEESRPETVFTLGGGCDAGLTAAAYLNARYEGNLCLVWFDAHADLNTPESSPSGMFCGMPLRVLAGEGDAEIVKMLPKAFRPAQLVMAGVRTMDKAEADFISVHSIPVINGAELEQREEGLLEAVRNTGCDNVYVHIDLDVLDPEIFPATRFTEPGGISPETLLAQVNALNEKFSVKGMGIFEYAPSDGKFYPWLAHLVKLGSSLGLKG